MTGIKPKGKDKTAEAIGKILSPAPAKQYKHKDRVKMEKQLSDGLCVYLTHKSVFYYPGNAEFNGTPSLLIMPRNHITGLAIWCKAPGCINNSSPQQEKAIYLFEESGYKILIVDDINNALREIDKHVSI